MNLLFQIGSAETKVGPGPEKEIFIGPEPGRIRVDPQLPTIKRVSMRLSRIMSNIEALDEI